MRGGEVQLKPTGSSVSSRQGWCELRRNPAVIDVWRQADFKQYTSAQLYDRADQSYLWGRTILFREGVRYYKIGVDLIGVASKKHRQLDLFNPPTVKPALMLTLDHINWRYGSDTLFIVAQGIEQNGQCGEICWRLNIRLSGEVCRA